MADRKRQDDRDDDDRADKFVYQEGDLVLLDVVPVADDDDADDEDAEA